MMESPMKIVQIDNSVRNYECEPQYYPLKQVFFGF